MIGCLMAQVMSKLTDETQAYHTTEYARLADVRLVTMQSHVVSTVVASGCADASC